MPVLGNSAAEEVPTGAEAEAAEAVQAEQPQTENLTPEVNATKQILTDVFGMSPEDAHAFAAEFHILTKCAKMLVHTESQFAVMDAAGYGLAAENVEDETKHGVLDLLIAVKELKVDAMCAALDGPDARSSKAEVLASRHGDLATRIDAFVEKLPDMGEEEREKEHEEWRAWMDRGDEGPMPRSHARWLVACRDKLTEAKKHEMRAPKELVAEHVRIAELGLGHAVRLHKAGEERALRMLRELKAGRMTARDINKARFKPDSTFEGLRVAKSDFVSRWNRTAQAVYSRSTRNRMLMHMPSLDRSAADRDHFKQFTEKMAEALVSKELMLSVLENYQRSTGVYNAYR